MGSRRGREQRASGDETCIILSSLAQAKIGERESRLDRLGVLPAGVSFSSTSFWTLKVYLLPSPSLEGAALGKMIHCDYVRGEYEFK